MDRVDAKTRSRIMSQVRGRDSKMELAVRPVLEALGFIYQPKGVIGRPDFVHPAAKVSVFLDGCFWHGYPEHYKLPKTNQDFWSRKISHNRTYDNKVTRLLELEGWRVIRVWEHHLKHLLGKKKLNQPSAGFKKR